MNCHEFEGVLITQIYGKPIPSQTDNLISHMKACPACAKQYEQIIHSRNQFEKRDDVHIQDWEKSWCKIADRSLKKKPVRPFYIPSPKFAIAAAALVIVFVIGFFVGKNYFFKNSDEYLFLSEEDHRYTSPFLSYARSVELTLINFMNLNDQHSEEEILAFEEKITSNILIQTRLLQQLISQRDDPYMRDLLEDLEFILVSISNLRPGDKDAAEQLKKFIRKKHHNNRLYLLMSEKTI